MKTVFSKPRTLILALAITIPFQLFPMGEQPSSSSWVDTIRSYMTGKTALWAGVITAGGLAIGALVKKYYFKPVLSDSLSTAGFNMQKAGDIYRIASILRMDDALKKKKEGERGDQVLLSSDLRKKYEDRLKQLKAGGEWYYELADNGKLDSPKIVPFLRNIIKEGTYSDNTIIQFLDIVHSLARLRVIEVSASFFYEIISVYDLTIRRYPFAEELLKVGVSLDYRPSDKDYSMLLDRVVYLGYFLSGHLGEDGIVAPTLEGITEFLTIPTLFVDVAEDIQKKCLASLSSPRATYLKNSDMPADVIKKIGKYGVTDIASDDAFIKEIVDKIVTRINTWKEKYGSIPAGATQFSIANISRTLVQTTWQYEKIDENLKVLTIKIKNWCKEKQATLKQYFLIKPLVDFKATDEEKVRMIKQRDAREKEAQEMAEAQEFTYVYERQENKEANSPAK